MFLQKLLDPEDERRRRVRRARIVRRNRIKKEVAQGLPLRRRRVPRASDYALQLDSEEWSESTTSPYQPTFGGNSDESKQSRGAGRVKLIRALSQQSTLSPSPTLSNYTSGASLSASTSSPSTGSSTVSSSPAFTVSADMKHDKRLMSPHIRARWKEAVQRVVFQRHEEILAKDPNRKWRQERFGLLLFAKQDYARASEHLNKAITLGATSSLCWRRLAESYFHMWDDGAEWELLWACRAAYEQALSHLEVACNPFVLLTYAKVLEMLGSYTGALTICASILQTFPKFEQLREVKLCFVLLQRYQLFSSSSSNDPGVEGDAVARSGKQALLTKCIGYTQELLLDKAITEGPRHINVMYLHTRLNELLSEATAAEAPAGQNQVANAPKTEGQIQTPAAPKPKIVLSSIDILFQELCKLATKDGRIAPPPGVKWKAWKSRSETYTAFAEYFRSQGESVLASDALSRSLELLEALPSEKKNTGKRANPWRGTTEDQRHKRISVYVVLARNYYQCNQMEKAIRAMEAVFQLDSLHAEARASLTEWFPAKWQYRLELEDASQVQIARVLRGIWGREIACLFRREAQYLAEKKYRENPYHLGCRRHVLRLLRDKYASLFVAQDLAVRCIQRRAKKYLTYARVRSKTEGQHGKRLHELRSKYQTRKYRYNRQVRTKLAELLPDEYESRFYREECSALRIQRCFRGNRIRREFRCLRAAKRQQRQLQQDAVCAIQRFFRRYCRAHSSPAPNAEELLFRVQNQLARARKRLALMLQRLYRRWKAPQLRKKSTLFAVFEAEASEQRRVLLEHTSVLKIQRQWRLYTAGKALGGRVSSQAHVLFVEHFFSAQRRQTYLKGDLDHAARKIQALYRGKLMRKFLGLLRDRILAPPCPRPVVTLIRKCEKQQKEGVETLAVLHSIDNLEEKRALFDHSVIVLGGALRSGSPPTNESFPLQHLVSAIQYSTVLKCLVIASGDFAGDRIITLLQALQTRRALRVLALGKINIILGKITTNQEGDAANGSPTKSTDSFDMDEEDIATGPTLSMALSQRSLLPPSSPQPHQKRQPSAMQTIAKALCTSNFLLEELYLEQNALLQRPQEGAIVADIVSDYFFARYGRLHTLVIANMRFSDANAALLGAALAINTVLQKLDLHGNLLCDRAAVAMANDGLAHNKSLRYLNLAENTIGSAGAKALFKCLTTSNRSLQILVLRNNHLMSDVLPSLFEAWQVNPVIDSVDLAGNLINKYHLKQVRAATAERREVTPSKENQDLRILLARRRFGSRDVGSPFGRKGIGIFATTLVSPSRRGDFKKNKNAPLSPKKWLSANAPKIISPLHYPAVANREAHEMHPAPKFSVENMYAPVQPYKKDVKAPPSSVRLTSPSKLPSLPIQKRLAW